MALGLTNRGSGTHNTSATSFTLSPGSNLAAGSLAVLAVSADNSSSGGATNDFGAVTDSLGNTWTRQRNPIFDPGAASAGVQTAIYTTPQNAGALATGTVITVNFGSSPTAKTWTLTEVTHAANAEAVVSGGADQAGATTATPSFASSSIAVGDAVLFIVGMEAGTTQTATADADATNGAWSTQQYAEIGSTTSGSAIASQGKVQTTTPSAQTYNPTLGISSDLLVSYVIIHEQHTASVSQTFTGGGVLVASLKTARSRSEVDTGGGVLVATKTTARSRAMVDTGGGVAVPSLTTSRRRSETDTGGGVFTSSASKRGLFAVVGTGGGIVTLDVAVVSVENHNVSVVATGGGVAFSAGVTGRALAATGTGAGVATIASSSARASSTSATGGGVLVAGIRTARSPSFAGTGGGVLALSETTSRSRAVGATGGGIFVLGSAGAVSVTATGGGAATLVATSARSRSVASTGAGAVLLDVASPRSSSTTSTGGGAVVLEATSDRPSSLVGTGGGVVVVGVPGPVIIATVTGGDSAETSVVGSSAPVLLVPGDSAIVSVVGSDSAATEVH